MPKYEQFLMDTYSDTVLLMKQITKKHQKFDNTWNQINDHPNVVNDTLSRQKEEFSQQFTISSLGQLNIKI